jgi:RNA polymerase sigma-70 factor (ECF subfamily)
MTGQQGGTDAQLVKAAQEGKSAAFGELYERYTLDIFRYLYAHLDSRLDAEDLTEEVFYRAWRSLLKYRELGNPFLAFLFRIARNTLIDFYRKAGRQDVNLPLGEESASSGQDLEAEEIVLETLEHQEIRKVLSKMREDYRYVLILRFIDKISPAETAVAMERSEGAVRVLQHRALAELRKSLEEE